MPGHDNESIESPPDLTPLLWPNVVAHPDEFIKQLTGITSRWFKESPEIRPWFRGMPRLSFSLEPSLLRYRRPGTNLLGLENNLAGQFRSYGARLLDKVPDLDSLELFTVMQHHGVPTRLLDWTENALAALYFAVRPFEHLHAEEDAVVWLLEPIRLARLKGADRIFFGEGRFDALANLPLPIYPVHLSPRVTPQRGTFTLHDFTPQHALVKLALGEAKEGRLPPLGGLRIRADRRTFIRRALADAFGLGEFTFFPDLDGLARELRIREILEGQG